MTIMDSTQTGTLSFHHITCEILLGASSETKRCLSCKKQRKSIFNNNDFHHVKNGLNPWYVCRYHEYKTIWDSPVLDKELKCFIQIGNLYNPMANAIKEIYGETMMVNHILQRTLALCSIFI